MIDWFIYLELPNFNWLKTQNIYLQEHDVIYYLRWRYNFSVFVYFYTFGPA